MNQHTPASKFVVYYRVSTKGQKESGLGLEAQQAAVTAYLATQEGAELVAQLEEVESGKNNKRPQLAEALKLCKRHKATLLIAKLDRLARNVHFISGLMESAVNFVACDNPHANRLMVHMLAAFAEHEREMISQRTKEGLRAAKAKGVVLGATGKIRGAENKAKADQHATAIVNAVRAIPEDDRTTVASLTREMNSRRIPTLRGGAWHRQGVYNLLRRFSQLGLQI